MKQTVGAVILFSGISGFLGTAYSQDCSNLPTTFTGDQFPTGNFFSNFINNCYVIPLGTGNGALGSGGDLNAVYQRIYFKVNPAYQLIIQGTFPNARYFSVTTYDEHAAIGQTIIDADITPLQSTYVNPFLPGVAYVAGQEFAVPVNFGGTPGTEQPGCQMNGYNVNQNALDGTQRHQGMDWNSDPSFWAHDPTFSTYHVVDTPTHSNPNTAGVVIIRTYLDLSSSGTNSGPFAILRDVASGCAYPAAYAVNTLQILTDDQTTGNSWLNSAQHQAHYYYSYDYLPKYAYAIDSQAAVNWLRDPQYIPGGNPADNYINAIVQSGITTALASAGKVMRVRFQLPIMPPTPCTNGCSRSGDEQLRYFSLSFQAGQGATLASIADSAFTQDAFGNVTLIVGTGAPIPSWITPANGYSFLDLTSSSGYAGLSSLMMRNILPSSGFNCSGAMIPYGTGDYTPSGGLMGVYGPLVDYPVASSLPTVAAPAGQTDTCGAFPDGQPGIMPAYGVVTPPPTSISEVVTQCPAPGCTQFAVQAQPPITIAGAGFGNFPNGLPFTGVSNYLEITDVTQGWDAGYGTDTCTVAINNWTNGLISLVANVNQNGACAMAAGDKLKVKVWNPQTGAPPGTYTVTVSAPTN
jgi:hypothetical protein